MNFDFLDKNVEDDDNPYTAHYQGDDQSGFNISLRDFDSNQYNSTSTTPPTFIRTPDIVPKLNLKFLNHNLLFSKLNKLSKTQDQDQDKEEEQVYSQYDQTSSSSDSDSIEDNGLKTKET